MAQDFSQIDYSNTLEPRSGTFLLANVNLQDPNFCRAVVLLCEHNAEGTFGLVLNQSLPAVLSQGVADLMGWDAPLYRGGPVGPGSLHFIHTRTDLDIGSELVAPGICWGGDFNEVNRLMASGETQPDEFRFFVGYSGWDEGQLDQEISDCAWYLTPAASAMTFEPHGTRLWERVLTTMGPEFAMLRHLPRDPRVN